MRISVIAVGRLRPPYVDDMSHYHKLLAGLARVEVTEVREDEQVPGRIPDRAYIVLLSGEGRTFDSVAFSDAGMDAVTFSRGTFRSLARVHTRRDDTAHLAGTGIAETATLIAATARAIGDRR